MIEGNTRVALSKRKGSNSWVVTAFETDVREGATGKGNNNLNATNISSTLPHTDTGASRTNNILSNIVEVNNSNDMQFSRTTTGIDDPLDYRNLAKDCHA